MTDFERVMGYLTGRPSQETDKELEFGLTILLDALEDLAEGGRLAEVSAWVQKNDVREMKEIYRTGLLRYTVRWRREIPMWQEALSKSFDHMKEEQGMEAAMRAHRGLLL
jgi:hypothetical protein